MTHNRELIFNLVDELTVMSNQKSVKTEVIMLAAIYHKLCEVESRLSAIEMNLAFPQKELPNEPATPRTPGPAPAAAKPASS